MLLTISLADSKRCCRWSKRKRMMPSCDVIVLKYDKLIRLKSFHFSRTT